MEGGSFLGRLDLGNHRAAGWQEEGRERRLGVAGQLAEKFARTRKRGRGVLDGAITGEKGFEGGFEVEQGVQREQDGQLYVCGFVVSVRVAGGLIRVARDIVSVALHVDGLWSSDV